MENNFIFNIFLALLLGAMLGLKNQYESKNQTAIVIGGFRTYSLLSLMGVISALLATQGMIVFTVLITGTIASMIAIYYASGVFRAKAYGITDEIAMLFAHLIGITIILQPFSIKLLVALCVIVVVILTRKNEIRYLGGNINQRELLEFTLFAIIVLVILPFLPNQSIRLFQIAPLHNLISSINYNLASSYSQLEIINPFKTWFVVVLVSAIDIISYILKKFIPEKSSRFISAIVGGFVSSTSTTVALAAKSKNIKDQEQQNSLLAAGLAANSSSFVQILLLVTPISFILLKQIFWPTVVLALGTMAIALWLNRSVRRDNSSQIKVTDIWQDQKIFNLEAAVKFAIIFTVIKFLSQLALIVFGSSGFVITSMFAGLSGMDAVILSLGELTQKGEIVIFLAYITYMATNLVNILSKAIYAYTAGGRQFAKKFLIYTLLVYLIALQVGLFFS